MAAILVLLITWSIAVGSSAAPTTGSTEDPVTDLGLYRAIAERVGDGGSYYGAAVSEQLAQGYPVQPAMTVRLPTTTYVNVALGENGARGLLLGLAVVSVLVAVVRFEQAARSRFEWWTATVLLMLALVVVLAPGGTLFSETWASLLLLLAALADPRRRPWLALVLVVAALVFRELALLFVAPVVILLWRAGRRRAAVAWAATGALYVAAYGIGHRVLVGNAVASTAESPRASGGWADLGGWPRVVDYVHRVSLLDTVPFWVSAVVVPLAVLGLAMRRTPITTSLLAGAAGFLVTFTVIGRENNPYWGLLYVALVLPGLAFAPAALREIWRSGFRGRATS